MLPYENASVLAMSDTPHTSTPDLPNLDVTLKENRKFAPPAEFSSRALLGKADYDRQMALSRTDPEQYWEEAAKALKWTKPWFRVLDWNVPALEAKWFLGGKINASFNCLDRHLDGMAAKDALVWEGEPGETAHWSYAQLHQQTERLVTALRKIGLRSGDRVAIYMPMIPEAVVAMLACARGGFTHTVVFGGFSSDALKDRIQDAQAKLILTADGGYRKGAWIPLRQNAVTAAKACPSVKHIITVNRALASQLTPKVPRLRHFSSFEIDYHSFLISINEDEVTDMGRPEILDSEHPLFILYTSGTTGKPKGILHTTGGYLTGVLETTRTVLDLKPEDVYWCTADIGWVTGHSYVVYGPLAAGATIFMYEGAPTHPKPDRIWDMIERHQISILYTAPTAIRSFMKLGNDPVEAHNLSSLRLLGTVGEPINPEAWMWYKDVVGKGRCPIVDTYWQTETGAMVIAPIPGVTATKPGSATLPLPGYDVDIVDKQGKPVPPGAGGYLVIRKPWPSMARTIFGDAERFKKTYYSEFPGGIYFTGDGARKDEDGYIWCLGRVDDVLNVSGHRLGTMEVESALVSHPAVAEAAVVGRPDDLKGQAIVAFVTLKTEYSKKIGTDETLTNDIRDQLKAHVVKEIGALARPDEIRLTDSLPKTRSGKIMRRLLRELASQGHVSGDTTTLEDFSVIASLQQSEE
jgi:acetyl-CoA synthetase